MITEAHSTMSSYREMLLEHVFVGELLRYLWIHGHTHAEFLKPQTDDAGYDIVIECNSILRHIQLKTTHAQGRRANVDVHLRLATKPGGCVLWMFFDPDSLTLGPFLWFGGGPHERLPNVSDFKMAKHTKGDSTGTKSFRPHIRLIPKGRFERLSSIGEVAEKLFGGLCA